MKECLEELASAQEKRAYIQGYTDCIYCSTWGSEEERKIKVGRKSSCLLKGAFITFTASRKHFATNRLFE